MKIPCRANDLTGLVYTHMLVVSYEGKSPSGKLRWNCKCICGKLLVVLGTNLKSGTTKSCGCSRIKHGMAGEPVYYTWEMMIQRCTNMKNTNYSYYGGRGISVCKEWFKFEKFFADMGDRPKGKTLDRIDCDKDYSLENCRWATPREQSLNRRIPCSNTSGFKGVYWQKSSGKWLASVTVEGKQKHLGIFTNKEDAIAARKAGEEKYYK